MINLYEVVALENQIEHIAEQNDGEIPEELLKQLVEAQTQSLQQVENLVKYIRHLDLGISMCKDEENRIKTMREKAEKRIESIKKYLTPYVAKEGKIEIGTFKLSIRKSESVGINNENYIPIEYMIEVPTYLKPDKNLIKKDLKVGKEIPGAWLEFHDNLQIK
jgi:hypothetical protein